jgi:hypothetical protein
MLQQESMTGLIDFEEFAAKITERYEDKQEIKRSIIHALKVRDHLWLYY